MSKFDKTLETFINDGLQKSSNTTISISRAGGNEQIGYKAALLDEAISTGLGISSIVENRRMNDGSFNNPAMGTGYSNLMLNSGYFMQNMITFDRTELTAIYHGCWVFRRMVDIPARDMWSHGISIANENGSEDLARVYSVYNRVKSDMIYATQQSRIYGGAAAFIMVDDGESDLSKPLRIDNIRKGSPINFIITDRWYGLEWSSELVDNYKSSDFGKPKYYSFFVEGEDNLIGQKIHYSRVLRFVNRRSPRIVEQQLQGWGISELEHVMQDLMNHENTKNAISSLLNKALLEIVKLEGMRNTMAGLSAGNPQASQMFASQMTALNNYRTSNKLVFMDKQDEYEQSTYSFAGLSDILNSQKDIVSGAAEMPEVLLFGTNRAGLNGDNPVELRIYADMILGRQEQECRPVVDKLLPILFKIAGVEKPRHINYEFESILDSTNESKQSALQSVVSNSMQLVDSELITRETALEEIVAAQKQTGFGVNITERDYELAREMDKQARENPQGAEMIGGGMPPELDSEFSEEDDVGDEIEEELSDSMPKSQSYDDVKEKIIKATMRDRHKVFKLKQ